MNENRWPEFVTDTDAPVQPRSRLAQLTGWETVVFELDDADLQVWESDFSTAILAP
ncbi:MAG TPA: hypothetical protein VND45_06610 [Thermoanaerobaculia bacterium]|jgi:hypothetical protein|nr:hypothetical protein [Thermoanaerobaculia bacterium]